MNERQTAEWLMEREDFLILTHVRPDGDTIGCAAGLCLALLGGGGHAAASGATVEGSVEEAKRAILWAIEQVRHG